jgi:MarR family transcriptional regulator, transcriptional regulator for hemolysin
MADPNLERSFGFVLHDVARLLRKRFEQRAKGLGLTRAQWQLLAHLKRHEGINQAGLAEILELEPITVARLIDRMEEAGWVTRRADPTDRRAHRLYMTERAHPVLTGIMALGEDLLSEALAGLGERERTLLLDLLIHVRANLSDRTPRLASREEASEETNRPPADLLESAR